MVSHLGAAILLIVSAGIAGAQSEQDFLRAIAADPRASRPHGEYGVFLQQQGRTVEAVTQFSLALDLDPRSPDAAYNLALALLNADRAAEALQILDKHPVASADSHALRGAVLNALGRQPEAADALRRAIATDPNNPDSLYDLVLTLLKIDSVPEAADLLSRGRRRFPRIAKIHAASGMVAYLMGKYDQAIGAYETAIKVEPNAADFHASLGDVFDATGELAKAGNAYARAVRIDPSTSAYHVKHGRNLLKLLRPKQAGAAFAEALKRNPADAGAHFQLGKLAAAASDHAAAVSHFEKALAANPSLKEAWYQLSLSYRRAGEEAKSRAAMEQSRKLP